MSHNLVRVGVSPEILANMLFPSMPGMWTRIDEGLPRDAKPVSHGYDFHTNQFYFVLSHPDFPEVPEGEMVPTFRNVQITAFVLGSPMTERQIAELNELTLKQIKMEELLNQQRYAQLHGELLPVFDLKKISEMPRDMNFKSPGDPDGDPPAVVVG